LGFSGKKSQICGVQENVVVAFVLLGIGQTFLNMNWSVAVDMTL
jgi:hypothetical protein